jgi:serine/threonine protein kinase
MTGRLPPGITQRFRIEAGFAAGATGALHLATDTTTGTVGLLKLVHSAASLTPSERTRLVRELEKLASLRHPGLAEVHAAGLEGELPWLFRERIEGEPLAERLSRGPLPAAEALALAGQLASALDELHRAGLLQRDLSPSHIVLRSDRPQAVLVDACVAGRIVSAGLFEVTGKPAYVSPEHAQGKLVSFRSDLYSLGAVLFHAVTGAPLFQGSADEILAAQRDQPAPALPPGLLPGSIATLLVQLLHKEPRDRPFSAQQVRRALEPFVPAGTIAAPPSAPKKTLVGVPAPLGAPRESPPSQRDAGLRIPPPPPPRVSPGSDATVPLTPVDLARAEAVLAKTEPTSRPPPPPGPVRSGAPASLPPPPPGKATSQRPPPPPAASADDLDYDDLAETKARDVEAHPIEPLAAAPGAPSTTGAAAPSIAAAPGLVAGASGAATPAPARAEIPAAGAFGPAPAASGPGTAPAPFGAPSAAAAQGGGIATPPGAPSPFGAPSATPGGPPAAPAVSAVPAPGAPPVGPAERPRTIPVLLWVAAAAAVFFLVAAVAGGLVGYHVVTRDAAPAAGALAPAAAAPTAPAQPIPPPLAAAPPVPTTPALSPPPASPPPAPPPAPAATPPAAPALPPGPAPAPPPGPAPARAATTTPSEAPPARAGAERPASGTGEAAPTAPAPGRLASRIGGGAAATPPAAVPTGGGAEGFDEIRTRAAEAFRARRYGDAERDYLAATRLNPRHAGSWAGLGASRLAQRNARGAAEAYREAVALQPTSPGFHAALGRALAESGDRAGARREYEEALRIDPDHRDARIGLERL